MYFGDIYALHFIWVIPDQGISHHFTIVERDAGDAMSHELRYFRAREGGDSELAQDAFPVMPLPDGERDTAWILPDLERHLEAGNIYIAQELAYKVADFYGEDFPDPLDLGTLNFEPEYYIGYGVSSSDSPSLEVVKTWMDGTERRFDTLTVAEYGMFEEAALNEDELQNVLETEGLEATLNLAETMAVASGYLDPERDDPRIFFEDDAPVDSFTTNRERELLDLDDGIAIIDAGNDFDTEEFEPISLIDNDATIYQEWGQEIHQKREANTSLEGVEWFEATFDEGELLEPLDPTVNYMLVAEATDPWTVELEVGKVWKAENGYMGYEAQSVQTYDPEDREQAEADRDALLDIYAERGLTAMMHKVELKAIQNDELDPHRANLALFREGPADRFETLAQRLEGEMNPYAIHIDEADIDDPIDQPDVDELQNNYHRLDVRETQSPQGEVLGYVVLASAYPELPNDFDDTEIDDSQYPSKAWVLDLAHFDDEQSARKYVGDDRETPLTDLAEDAISDTWQSWDMRDVNHFMAGHPQVIEPETWQAQEKTPDNPYWRLDALPVNDPDGEPLGHALHIVVYPDVPNQAQPELSEDTPFQMMEMAHFETQQQMEEFSKEFRGYLMPDVLEGPELAKEVASLEGFSTEYRTLEGEDLTDYQNAELTLTRTPKQWHPYNPNAERDARIEAEGLYNDTIYDAMSGNDIEF